MRHGKRFNHLGRTSSHRKATLANMASSLIVHKRLTTTVAKAKALRQYVEPLITRSKVDSTHSRRVVFSYLKDKDSSRVLFDEVAERIAERPGGYTRIIKLGNRLGDNAEMCMIELVDFNETYNQEEKQSRGKTRRSRRGSKKKSTEQTAAPVSSESTPEVEAQSAETTDEVAEAEAQEGDVQEAPSAENEEQEEGEVVKVSGEATVDEPVAIEETETVENETEIEASTDEAQEDTSDDTDETKPKD